MIPFLPKSYLILYQHPLLCLHITQFFFFSPNRELQFFQQWKNLSLYITAAGAVSANVEFMWLYKWQALPSDVMHFIFPCIYHPQRPSILLRVALSLAWADKTAMASHNAYRNLSPSLYLFVSPSAGKTSQVLWEHYEDLEAKAGLLCSGLLRTGLPSVPPGLCL